MQCAGGTGRSSAAGLTIPLRGCDMCSRPARRRAFARTGNGGVGHRAVFQFLLGDLHGGGHRRRMQSATVEETGSKTGRRLPPDGIVESGGDCLLVKWRMVEVRFHRFGYLFECMAPRSRKRRAKARRFPVGRYPAALLPECTAEGEPGAAQALLFHARLRPVAHAAGEQRPQP